MTSLTPLLCCHAGGDAAGNNSTGDLVKNTSTTNVLPSGAGTGVSLHTPDAVLLTIPTGLSHPVHLMFKLLTTGNARVTKLIVRVLPLVLEDLFSSRQIISLVTNRYPHVPVQSHHFPVYRVLHQVFLFFI